MEILGSMNDSAYHFFEDLGRKINEVSGDSREESFIFQRLSVTIQRFNAALFNESFTRHDLEECSRQGAVQIHVYLIFTLQCVSLPQAFMVVRPYTWTVHFILLHKNCTVNNSERRNSAVLALGTEQSGT